MVQNIKIYFQITTTSGVPIYRQIIDQVKMNIAAARFNPDDFLPSVRQVAGKLEINPMTVSKAYSLLEKEGVLENVRGKGMKIKSKKAANVQATNSEEALKPLLKEVIAKARQLSVDPRRISEMIEEMRRKTQ